ncbi:hypothetical protein ACT453_58610, partial [Bacillus sp. D-CC]
LMRANQNSSSPNTFTDKKLKALIKIVTIICMIVVGAGIILFGFGNGGIATGISNLWSHGGWFPNGFSGLLLSMQMVL